MLEFSRHSPVGMFALLCAGNSMESVSLFWFVWTLVCAVVREHLKAMVRVELKIQTSQVEVHFVRR